jgi:thioredoxin-related protein
MHYIAILGSRSARFAFACALGVVSLLVVQTDASASNASSATSVAWVNPDRGDASAAFARARAENKPVFLFWTAKWCPPCNHVKSTIFTRADFIEASKSFVPLYIDGDAPGAQRLGTQYGVTAYPTSIVFAPDGREITRLPGEVDPAKYMRLMSLGMKATRPVKQIMTSALAGEALSADEWDLLTFYSWETDQDKVVSEKDRASTLQKLAQRAAAAQPKVASRLQLKALSFAASQSAKAKGDVPDSEQAIAHAQLTRTLADVQAVRENFDILSWRAGDLTRYATDANSPRRTSLRNNFNNALDGIITHSQSSHADRLAAMVGKIRLAALDLPDAKTAESKNKPKFPAALVAQARDVVKAADTQTSDRMTRQATMSTAAFVLSEVGLLDESDALLKAELGKAISPHYYLSDLSENAKKRGDKAGAIAYAQQAYEKGEGAATRVQWGGLYVRVLVADAPQDTARIVTATKSVIAETQAAPDAFYERSLRSLQRVGKALDDWANTDARRNALAGLRSDLDRVCEKLPANDPAAANCRGAFRPKAQASS